LPCSFYEAGFFGVPCLAVHGFEVGDMIERLDAGWTFGQPLEDQIVRFFERLTPTAYEEMREKLLALPPGRFVAGEDVAVMCEMLGLGRREDCAPVRPIRDRARG
jgi:succinoglycan biosynthesis protein ExoL